MGRFINPFTDVGFKRIFGQEINKDLLIDFLNALLEGEKKIKDITFLDKELLPEFEKDRSVIYDVYCTDESNEQFIVEDMFDEDGTIEVANRPKALIWIKVPFLVKPYYMLRKVSL